MALTNRHLKNAKLKTTVPHIPELVLLGVGSPFVMEFEETCSRLETEITAYITNTDDPDSYLPIHRLRELADEGRIGSLARRCHGVPTEYSQRRTIDRDAPEVLRRLREDGADVAMLVPL